MSRVTEAGEMKNKIEEGGIEDWAGGMTHKDAILLTHCDRRGQLLWGQRCELGCSKPNVRTSPRNNLDMWIKDGTMQIWIETQATRTLGKLAFHSWLMCDRPCPTLIPTSPHLGQKNWRGPILVFSWLWCPSLPVGDIGPQRARKPDTTGTKSHQKQTQLPHNSAWPMVTMRM